MKTEKKFYTAKDLTEIMGICYAKALAFIKYSGIPHIKINRTYLVSKETFYTFINESKNICIDV